MNDQNPGQTMQYDTATEWTTITDGENICEVAILHVTPAMAALFLEHKAKNRHVKVGQVELVSSQLRAGLWRFNGETIIFDTDGRLIDGQHRCAGCVSSQVPFTTLAVRNIASACFETIDAGSKRTAGDILGIEGTLHANLIAATMSLLLEYEHSGAWWNPKNNVTSATIRGALPRYDGLVELAPLSQNLSKAIGYRSSMWLAAAYLARQKNATDSAMFFDRVLHGTGLNNGDPELTFRNKMLQFKGAKLGLKPKSFAAMIVNAWNARRSSRQLHIMRGLIDDSQPGAFK